MWQVIMSQCSSCLHKCSSTVLHKEKNNSKLLQMPNYICKLWIFFFHSCNRTFGLPASWEEEIGMSNVDSYNCIFVLFSLLEDHFFFNVIVYVSISHFLTRKSVSFSYHIQRKYCIISAEWQGHYLISWFSLYWEAERIYWLILSEVGSNVNSPVDFGEIWNLFCLFLSILWKQYSQAPNIQWSFLCSCR